MIGPATRHTSRVGIPKGGNIQNMLTALYITPNTGERLVLEAKQNHHTEI